MDCALDLTGACPSDYACLDEPNGPGGSERHLCVPQSGAGATDCLTALGGFCAGGAQACSETNDAGTCSGDRTCAGGRFSACPAATPQLLGSCGASPPAGCQESVAPAVLDDPNHCGTCPNVCAGQDLGNDDVSCPAGACVLTCRGENYDVNGDPADGCEVVDNPQGNHTPSTATNEGSADCSDPDSTFTWYGEIPSDQRVHTNPTVTGFVDSAGAAPDWFSYLGTGENLPFTICVNDILATLVVTGSAQPTGCYELTVITDLNTWTAFTDGSGVATIQKSCGDFCAEYSSNSTIYYEVSKVCSAFEGHLVTYALRGHL